MTTKKNTKLNSKNMIEFKFTIKEKLSESVSVLNVQLELFSLPELESHFWMAKVQTIKNRKKGRLSVAEMKSYFPENYFEKYFTEYVIKNYSEAIFEKVREYTKSLSKSYLESNIVNTGVEIFVILTTSSLIDLSKIEINLKDEDFTSEIIEAASGEKAKWWQKYLRNFLNDNTNYYDNILPIVKDYDKVLIECETFLKDNPKIKTKELDINTIIVGTGTFLPEIDQGLIGSKADNRFKKINFVYQKEHIYAGFDGVFKFKILKVMSPEFTSLDEMLNNKKSKIKKIDGIGSEQELYTRFEQQCYGKIIQEAKFKIARQKVQETLVKDTPDFTFDTEVIQKNSQEYYDNFASKNPEKKELDFVVTTDYGKFVGDPSLPIKEQIFSSMYKEQKFKKVLQYVFFKYSKNIYYEENDDYETDEEIENYVNKFKEYRHLPNSEKGMIIGDIQRDRNIDKTFNWLTNRLLKNKNLDFLKLTK